MDKYTIQALLSECPKLKITTLRDIIASAYKEGYLMALTDCAWWKEGTQYVGSCGRTLKQAREEFERDLYYKSLVE